MSWQVVNKILNRNKQSHNVIKSRVVKNGKTITDDADIAEEFNNCFVNVGNSLASKINNTDVSPLSYLDKSPESSFFLKPVINADLVKAVKQIKKIFTPGYDDLTGEYIFKCLSLTRLFSKHISTNDRYS